MRLNWTITIFAAALLTGCATPPPAMPVQVNLLAINDFHGNLKAPQGGIRIKDPADPTKTINVPAGGAEQLATAVAELARTRTIFAPPAT
jgi:5'-nucleotidase